MSFSRRRSHVTQQEEVRTSTAHARPQTLWKQDLFSRRGSADCSEVFFPPGDEQRRGGLHRAEAGVRPVFQPLVRGAVPEGGPQRGPVHRELPEVPAVRAEGHQGQGHPDRWRGLHGPQQRQTRELIGSRGVLIRPEPGPGGLRGHAERLESVNWVTSGP